MKIMKLSFIVLCSFCLLVAECEILILGGLSLGAGIGYSLYRKFNCFYHECCTDDYIQPNLQRLDELFTKNVYGQHIAHKTILNALRGYLYHKDQPKALAFSFHGTAGTGKNYVVKFIAEALYKNGIKSKYFHYFVGRHDFSLDSNIDTYKIALRKKIEDSLVECPQSMFVFDEVDKMPEGLLNVLVPFLDYNVWSRKMNTSRAIFIFLSNTGSMQIVKRSLELWENGVDRSNTKLQDYENLIAIGAFNEKGGFHYSDTIETNVIDHYVPFLPLELPHVQKCIETAFLKKNVNPTQEMINEALSHIIFGPPPQNLYSKFGCKRIEQKVATIVYNYNK